MVKKLSCVSCGSLKRFPHTFTSDMVPVQWFLSKVKEKANSSSQNSNIDNQDFIILILRHCTGRLSEF